MARGLRIGHPAFQSFTDSFGYNENPMTSQGGIYQISPSDWNTPRVISGFGATAGAGNSNDYKDSQILVSATNTWSNRRHYRGVMAVASGAYARAAANGNLEHEIEFIHQGVWGYGGTQTIQHYELLFGFDGTGYSFVHARHNGVLGSSFNAPQGFVTAPTEYTSYSSSGISWNDGDIIDAYFDDWRVAVYWTPVATGIQQLIYDGEDTDGTNRLALGGRSGHAYFSRDDTNYTDFGWKSFYVAEY